MATGVELFDVTALQSDDTTTVQLVNPKTGEDITGAEVVVYGQDSDVFKAESRKIQQKAADYMRKNRGKTMPPEDFERLDRAKVIKCVKEIRGLSAGDNEITDPESLFKMVPDFYDQVVAGIMDRALFIKG